MVEELTERQRQTLQFIAETVADRGYPPSVREACEALGLASSSTVHSHLQALQRKGYIRIDPTKPRAIEVLFDPETGLAAENVEEIYPMPSDLVGDGNVFMLEVAGDSMIDAGIHDGDFVIVRQQPTAHSGEIVAAMMPSEFGDEAEATVKTIRHRGSAVWFEPSNPALQPFE